MEYIFRIFDFNVYNKEEMDEDMNPYKDNNQFMIQIFGVDEIGKTYSLITTGFRPFFYLMVNDTWNIEKKEQFLAHLKTKIGKYYEESITQCKLIKRKK